MSSLFDMIAEIVAMTKKCPEDHDPPDLAEDSELQIKEDVHRLTEVWKSQLVGSASSTNGLSSAPYSAIMDWCHEHNSYYCLRTLLSELDANREMGWEDLFCQNRYDGFKALNNNHASTGILILPKVHSAQTTYMQSRGREKPDVRSTADKQVDFLNSMLNHFYYIRQVDLGDYELKNYLILPGLSALSQETLRIGAAPMLNAPLQNVLSYDDTVRETNSDGTQQLYLDHLSVKNPKEVLRRFRYGYQTACNAGVHILMYPEMLGVDALYEEDSYQYNPLLKKIGETVCNESPPQLILAPSMWSNNQNCVNVYLPTGRKLCAQYKQHGYHFRGKEGMCKERLLNTPKEICLIHVPGWGRLVVIICIDYLKPDYRRLLVEKLKANILLCPSFSPGEYSFLQSLDSSSEYGTYTVWLNSCSALTKKCGQVPELSGAVSVPTVSSQSRITRFIPDKCNGGCQCGCLFVSELPLNCVGTSSYEGAGAIVNQVICSGRV